MVEIPRTNEISSRNLAHADSLLLRHEALALALTTHPSIDLAANNGNNAVGHLPASMLCVGGMKQPMMMRLTTPPPAPLAHLPAGVAIPPVTGKMEFTTPPREVLRQISPIMSPATISKNELNDAALALKFLSEGWRSVESKGGQAANTTKRPRSERRVSVCGVDGGEYHQGNTVQENVRRMSMTTMSMTTMTTTMTNAMATPPSAGMWADEHEGGFGYDDEHTPLYVGKSKRAASRKCAAMLKEALFEESQQALTGRQHAGARRSSLGTSSSGVAFGVTVGVGVGVGGRGTDIAGTPTTVPPVGGKKKAGVVKVMLAKGAGSGKRRGSGGGEGRKRSRNYSENSRVGRAVQNIYKYIIEHQTRYLRGGSKGVPERVIREEYGNNPDTSKALRYLVSENRINKEGAGGRRDPFSYTIRPVAPMGPEVEYDPKDKKTSLLRSLGMPPPELCMEGSGHGVSSAAGGGSGGVAKKKKEGTGKGVKGKGVEKKGVVMVEPPTSTTHGKTKEEALDNENSCLESTQQAVDAGAEVRAEARAASATLVGVRDLHASFAEDTPEKKAEMMSQIQEAVVTGAGAEA